MKLSPGQTRSAPQLRDVGAEQPKSIHGYGAVFYRADDPGTEYWLWYDMVERIMPGAFDSAIQKNADVRSLFNHDSNLLLGRTSSNTLALSVDATGLRYDVTPPNARADVLEAVQRKDVDGASFMFFPLESVWREERREDITIWIREITDVELLEVGPVVWPAYESTTADVRSDAGGAKAAPVSRYREWLETHIRSARESRDTWRQSRSSAVNRSRMLRAVEIDLDLRRAQ